MTTTIDVTVMVRGERVLPVDPNDWLDADSIEDLRDWAEEELGDDVELKTTVDDAGLAELWAAIQRRKQELAE